MKTLIGAPEPPEPRPVPIVTSTSSTAGTTIIVPMPGLPGGWWITTTGGTT
jgi:hypothetical protein